MKMVAILNALWFAISLGRSVVPSHLGEVGGGRAFSVPTAASIRSPESVSTQNTGTETPAAERATFAGGCFWCMEPPFDELPGVVATTSGYTGGRLKNPTYRQVSSGGTGHIESVEVLYDPNKVSYQKLLEIFWRNVDPTDRGGQFCDRGEQYRTAIFYHTEEQRRLAEASKRRLEEYGRLTKPIVTEIRSAVTFYPAEEYHQDYYKKNPFRYKLYRVGCGRDRVLERLWGSTPETTP